MNLDDNLIRLIDQRIRAAQQTNRATGTCVTRATTGPSADVIFDGSTVAMPVKVAGNVFVQPGFRCLLDKYGSDWVVTNAWSALGMGEASKAQFGPSGGNNTNSATFIDQTDITPFQFNKMFDATYVRAAMYVTCYTDVDGTAGRFAFRFNPLDSGSTYTPVDYDMVFIKLENGNGHQPGYHNYRIVGLPAGSYSVQLRWRRQAGTGTVRIDGNDIFVFELDEGVRANTPFL
jgi:hypothetical protein